MRQALRDLEGPGHPALWLGAHVPSLCPESKQKAIRKAAAWKPDDSYRDAYHRWQAALNALPSSTEELEVVSAVIVGLGGASPLETSVTLLHPYGAPVIPGSALKGLAASYARLELALDGAARAVLFGGIQEAGYITFPDAWWIPDRASTPLAPDVMTPHHSAYYGSIGECAPTDFDDPIPVPFVHARGRFLVGVICEDAEWRQFALDLLRQALADWGVGAKTAAGYGRLRRSQQAVDQEALQKQAAEHLLARIGSADPRSEGRNLFEEVMRPENESIRAQCLRALYPRLKKADMLRDKWIKEKEHARSWVRDFLDRCRECGIPA
ncbi:MAG TPA: type III-B CRISPR module RAMP protein Cmr6 [Armatimonadota bacterium]|nr:type III-B CRISPR module RAMP protein Cmr6 [Armatimonadota bacterium]